ncbi:secreted protein containing N-terminalzinc-dependent carboxypeptidase related domain [Nonlabens ulvanivorans]|uniref:Secreted protein containing N-terminalzinc-dependent carboxypeptidase related domain n=1 Tax=Nonlabens ulvanivorans TaxID=906888 RepID=A0A081DDM1_NONUL|nr:secreted protein containing N-terminalzinc-dependent carboxypeptidase related domain [Nonlabens ulvanivorans]
MNQQLTRKIGDFHAAELDKIGSLYYTEESYDDFYYGKGSTFPDVNGSIGILFEQASSRGHAQNSENGVLTFPFTIRNQFTAGISTLKAAVSMRQEILDYHKKFYADARKENNNGAIIFGDYTDAGRTDALADILMRHKIEVRSLKNDVTKNGKTYKKDFAYIVPKNQKNSRLIKAMFEKRTTFQDSLFYDISAWTFPLAFDMDYDENASLNDAMDEIAYKNGIGKINSSDYAYLMPWNEYKTPKILNILLSEGIRAKVAMKEFTIEGKDYDYGTILIPVQNQKWDASEFADRLGDIAIHEGLSFYGVQSGLTKGIDLGSRQFRALTLPKVALIIGDGVNPYDAGEIWHLLDQRYDMVVTKIDVNDINRKDLSRYNTIIVPATYGSPENEVVDQLKEWTRAGGTLIGYRSALRWMSSSKLLPLTFRSIDNPTNNITFEQRLIFMEHKI